MATRLDRDCGCDWSAAYFVIAVVGSAIYILGPGRLNLLDIAVAVAVPILAALLGKAFGLGVARLRLINLQRSLASRLEESVP